MIEAQSVQPYCDIEREQPGPRHLVRPRPAEVGGDEHVEQLGGSVASLQMLPSSKQGSLLPEYS